MKEVIGIAGEGLVEVRGTSARHREEYREQRVRDWREEERITVDQRVAGGMDGRPLMASIIYLQGGGKPREERMFRDLG